MARMVGKIVLSGVAAATLTLLSSGAFALDTEFSAAPVFADRYNAILAESVPPSEAMDVRFSGRLTLLDPYNATLLPAVLSSTATQAMEEFAASYAFAPDYPGPRVWEEVNPRR